MNVKEYAFSLVSRHFNWDIVKAAMKKKPIAEPIISPEILELAKKSVDVERRVPQKLCAVCGAACTPNAFLPNGDTEALCWVCRRLKISAWRDTDQQVSAQE
jgi:hypothetical protein